MYLSEVSGDVRFREKALAIRRLLKNIEKPKGLYWNFMDVQSGRFTRSKNKELHKFHFLQNELYANLFFLWQFF